MRTRRTSTTVTSLILVLLFAREVRGQELEPRSFSPSPVGTTFVFGGFGKSEGGILFDPSLDIDNVQADLWIITVGGGYTFGLRRRQAKVLGVLPIAWGTIAGNVHDQAQRQDLAGLADPVQALHRSRWRSCPDACRVRASTAADSPGRERDGRSSIGPVHVGTTRQPWLQPLGHQA